MIKRNVLISATVAVLSFTGAAVAAQLGSSSTPETVGTVQQPTSQATPERSKTTDTTTNPTAPVEEAPTPQNNRQRIDTNTTGIAANRADIDKNTGSIKAISTTAPVESKVPLATPAPKDPMTVTNFAYTFKPASATREYNLKLCVWETLSGGTWWIAAASPNTTDDGDCDGWNDLTVLTPSILSNLTNRPIDY